VLPVLDEKRAEIADICRGFGVVRLDVFGSAATGAFDPDRSDVDFIVEFPDGYDFGPWLKRYFDLNDALETLLGRSVDLVMSKAPSLADPFFAREVNRTRRPVYAA